MIYSRPLLTSLLLLSLLVALMTACGGDDSGQQQFAGEQEASIEVADTAVQELAAPEVEMIDPLEIGDPEKGEELFKDEFRFRCLGCHTLDGKTHRPGPTLQGISVNAAERVPGLSVMEYLRQSLFEPSAYIVPGFEDEPKQMEVYSIAEPDVNGHMDKFTLTEEELNDLLAFVLMH